MRKWMIIAACLPLAASQTLAADSDRERMDEFISGLMREMTVDEKLGQLNFVNGGVPGVVGAAVSQDDAIRQGLVGATGGFDPALSRHAQEVAVGESRLKIPLLFGLDVIHGHKTIFPIPLASSCSWNMDLIRRSAEIAAVEASATGVNWTFSPMIDICRDPRWGRIAEGGGEDPYLGSRIAEAMVAGYQGSDLTADTTILACVKHFALYGASEAGRDYNTVDMSRVYMNNYYMPPYKAAVDAGAATVMTSFNTVDGIPATGNKWLLSDLLRQTWGFDGFVVSDAGSIAEMTVHGMGDAEEVAALGLSAGTDMDLGSCNYFLNIKKALDDGIVTMDDLDRACRKILEAKYRLGLFDDPFRYFSDERAERFESAEHLAVARRLAAESVVLLKNDGALLPLKKEGKIAVVGPLADDAEQLIGTWVMSPGTYRKSVTEAFRQAVGGNGSVTSARGSNFTDEWCLYHGGDPATTDSLIAEAVKAASDADVVVAAVGEPSAWSGEARSRADISLPGSQKRLLAALKATGKPVVVVLLCGRPMTIEDEVEEFDAVLVGWHGGTMAAEALADVVFGDVNPSGKLSATFPRNVGQIPIYYNALNTGRPFNAGFWASTRYIDMTDNSPLFPFGYGLSYTDFNYGEITVDKTELSGDADRLKVRVAVSNDGRMDGQETVQLYIGDPAARISRPVIELKGFEKIALAAGEKRAVEFEVTTDMLCYYDADGNYGWDAGDFVISVGPNSANLSKTTVHWSK